MNRTNFCVIFFFSFFVHCAHAAGPIAIYAEGAQ
jgi:hypothetical protein